MTLTEFLLARIAEDEAEALGANGDGYRSGTVVTPTGYDLKVTVGGSRLRAECDAKRRIVEMHPPRKRGSWDECAVCFDPNTAAGEYDFETWPCPTLRALTLPYADHPDYRDEWAAS